MQLTPRILRLAYSNGLFPMPHPQTGEILWYSPDPRAVIPLDQFHASSSLLRTVRKKIFQVTYDQDFNGVIDGCSQRSETWINEEIKQAYQQLHELKDAHSVEVWQEGKLVGGVYGVAIGGAFFAESKFHRVTNASKIALYYLVERLKERKFKLLEVQFLTDHLKSLGAVEITARDYKSLLSDVLKLDVKF